MSQRMNQELEDLLAQLENVSTDEEAPSPVPSPRPMGFVGNYAAATLPTGEGGPQVRVATIQPAYSSVASIKYDAAPQTSPKAVYAQTSVVQGPTPQRGQPSQVAAPPPRRQAPRMDEDDGLSSLLHGFKKGIEPNVAPREVGAGTGATGLSGGGGGGGNWAGGVYRSPFEEEFLRAQQAEAAEAHEGEAARQRKLEEQEAARRQRTARTDTSSGCGRCSQPVSGSFLQALGREWHTNCFVCDDCHEALTGPTSRGDGSFYELDSRPYCDRCYRKAARQK